MTPYTVSTVHVHRPLGHASCPTGKMQHRHVLWISGRDDKRAGGLRESFGQRPYSVFQIDVRDLSFLRSIGIDPTRRLRRRRVG